MYSATAFVYALSNFFFNMNQNFHRNIITYFFSYVLENGKINITVPRSILRWHGMKNMLIEDNDDR